MNHYRATPMDHCFLIITALFLKVCVLQGSGIYTHQRSKDSEGVCSLNDTCVYPGNVSACPVWFHCNASNQCECGESHDFIKCNQRLQQVEVVDCYCVTYDKSKNRIVAGACFIRCATPHAHDLIDVVYHKIKTNVTVFNLNDEVCKETNRDGPLCGKCKNGSYPLAYSYNHTCIECPGRYGKWWLFIIVAYIPLTIFYFFMFFFQLNATSSYLHAYVFYSQIISMPANVRILLSATGTNPHISNGIKTLITLHGIWNLDFGRGFFSDICLKIDTLAVLALDYTIAVYPLLLTFISYFLIKLHDRKYRFTVILWRPIKKVLTLFHSNLNNRSSVIDTYVTFFLLSYTKFLSVSSDLLIPTRLYEVNSTGKLVLYYDGGKEYFGKEHLPYAILALVVMTFFNILPILLFIFYQFMWFQKLLNCLPLRLYVLHTFMDLLQGCYKNGTQPGTRDHRWFSAMYLIFRVVIFIVYTCTLNGMFFVFIIIIALLFCNLLVCIQPYKEEYAHHTAINTVFILTLILVCTGALCVNIAAIMGSGVFFFYALTSLIGMLPLAFMFTYTLYWIIKRKRLLSRFSAFLVQRL